MNHDEADGTVGRLPVRVPETDIALEEVLAGRI
jgi:hypothetical protein